jgi:Cu(I)/Ag(I) efflux system membrane protein CusA/SilA
MSTCAAATCAAPWLDLQRAVPREVRLPAGLASVSWSGQFEFLERARRGCKLVVPFTLLIIFVLLYLTFRRLDEALLIMATLPFALIGGMWLLWALGYQHVGGRRGRLYRAGRGGGGVRRHHAAVPEARPWAGAGSGGVDTDADLLDAIARRRGAARAPKAMTVAVILAGLTADPVRARHAGREVMQRIAAPMVGGMLSAPLLSHACGAGCLSSGSCQKHFLG